MKRAGAEAALSVSALFRYIRRMEEAKKKIGDLKPGDAVWSVRMREDVKGRWSASAKRKTVAAAGPDEKLIVVAGEGFEPPYVLKKWDSFAEVMDADGFGDCPSADAPSKEAAVKALKDEFFKNESRANKEAKRWRDAMSALEEV